MAGNPNVALGTLNKVRGALTYADNQGLNVTAPYLGRAGITATPTGAAAQLLPTMTGGVTSLEPYQLYDIVVHTVKTTPLAAAYKAQIESNCAVGDLTYIPDTSAMPNWQFKNCVITGAGEMSSNGTDPEYVVRLQGFYSVNSSMFNL